MSLATRDKELASLSPAACGGGSVSPVMLIERNVLKLSMSQPLPFITTLKRNYRPSKHPDKTQKHNCVGESVMLAHGSSFQSITAGSRSHHSHRGEGMDRCTHYLQPCLPVLSTISPTLYSPENTPKNGATSVRLGPLQSIDIFKTIPLVTMI